MINFLKSLVTITIFILLSSCSKKPTKYYLTHPEGLQKTIESCHNEVTSSKYCQKIFKIARKINLLALELQSDPQEFGERIIALQQKTRNKYENDDLELRMAVVSWLEAPRH
jgi:hypothetical protein